MMCNYSRNPTSSLVTFLIQKPVFVIVITNLLDSYNHANTYGSAHTYLTKNMNL